MLNSSHSLEYVVVWKPYSFTRTAPIHMALTVVRLCTKRSLLVLSSTSTSNST